MERYKQKAIKYIGLFSIVVVVGSLIFSYITYKMEYIFEDNIIERSILTAVGKYTISFLLLFLMIKWNLFSYFRTNKKRLISIIFCGFPFMFDIVSNLVLLRLVPANLIEINMVAVVTILLLEVGTSCVEEFSMRGILYPLLCEKWKKNNNGMLKAAFVISAIFGLLHISWIVFKLFVIGEVSSNEIIRCIYQILHTFCAGILFSGIIVYSGNLILAIIWHALVDISAYLYRGMISEMTYLFYIKDYTWINVLQQDGILLFLKNQNLFYITCIIINFIYLFVGIILIRKGEKYIIT